MVEAGLLRCSAESTEKRVDAASDRVRPLQEGMKEKLIRVGTESSLKQRQAMARDGINI